jgi:hypothetical protein
MQQFPQYFFFFFFRVGFATTFRNKRRNLSIIAKTAPAKRQ